MRQRLALWARFCQGYTRCFLTFPEKDKLVAISGLARKLGSEDDYRAGLWRQDLTGQLMWFVANAERPSTKAPERNLRAPSWSWASVNSPVYMGIISMGTNVNDLIKIVTIDVGHETQDPFGQLRGGRLQIEGPLIKTMLRCCTSTGWAIALQVSCPTWEISRTGARSIACLYIGFLMGILPYMVCSWSRLTK